MMKWVFLIHIWAGFAPFSLLTEGNFYFATHPTYITSSLHYTSFLSVKISGNWESVTQQCRRNCSLNADCRSFNVQLEQNRTELGVFYCRYFVSNPCNWTTTSLATGVLPSSRLWDKIPAQGMKAKPCVEYCAVKYSGNCAACRGYSGLTGLDCDIAPKLCSDYPSTGWAHYYIWPWGFYGPRLYPYCIEQRTNFLLYHLSSPGYATVQYLGLSNWIWNPYTTSPTVYASYLNGIDWSMFAELVALAERKELMVVFAYGTYYRYVYTGFELSPFGELSLNASLNNFDGFLSPLNITPFVYDSSCSGLFWQFSSNESICSQRTNLGLNGLTWNGGSYPSGSIYLTFS